MTLNSVMAVILRYLANFDSFGANYVKVVQLRQICSPKNLVFGNI